MGWVQLVGAGVSALSQKKQGQAAEDAANANADAMMANAAMKAARIRKMAGFQRGEALAATAASGVDVNSASSRVIQDSIRNNSEEDVSNTLLSGQRSATAIRDQGRAAGRASILNAAGTLISGFGSDYGRSVLSKVGTRLGKWKTAAPASSGGVGTT